VTHQASWTASYAVVGARPRESPFRLAQTHCLQGQQLTQLSNSKQLAHVSISYVLLIIYMLLYISTFQMSGKQ